jgi:hypothetical protein
MITNDSWQLTVNKNDIRKSKIAPNPRPQQLEKGQVLVKIKKLALTASNVAYAHFGTSRRFWDFFPSPVSGIGILPAWGFGEVVESANEDIPVGEWLYGFFPVASHLVMDAQKTNETIIQSVDLHRLEIASVYNNYTITEEKLDYNARYDDLQALFQPQFFHTFMLEDLLFEKGYFDSEQIVITSASSNIAILLAFLIAERRKQEGNSTKIIGLTTFSKAGYVRKSGFFDEIRGYEELNTLSKDEKTLIADFTGNKAMLEEIQDYFGESLTQLYLVGTSHWNKQISDKNDLTEKKSFFSALPRLKKRKEEWGDKELFDKMGERWIAFTRATLILVYIKKIDTTKKVSYHYQDLVADKLNCENSWLVEIG